MARAQKQKLARQSTAAYAASQPLFTAIKQGFERLGEQRAALVVARDLVQNLHVKIVHEGSIGERQNHMRYVAGIVTAWISAAEVYTNIFRQLANNTAADPTEGKPASKNHEDFVSMLDTAILAGKTARQMHLDEEIDVPVVKAAPPTSAPKTTPMEYPQSDDSASVPPPEPTFKSQPNHTAAGDKYARKRSRPDDEEVHQSPEQPKQKAQKRNPNVKYSKQGRPLWERGAEYPFVPYGTLGSSEKKEWQKEKQRQKREKTRAKREAKKRARADANAPKEDHSKPVFERDYISLDAGPDDGPPFPATNGVKVDYEDVSAEAAARLNAKEAKKASKAEKKRKRESGDSTLADEEGGQDRLVLLAENSIEKPQKKKPRKSDGSGKKKKSKSDVGG